MYLAGKYWQNLSSKFEYLSMDAFYDKGIVAISKINLIQISNELGIPKETIRRKINELEKSNILTREGKTIIFNKNGIDFQKPIDTIDSLSIFIEKNSKVLSAYKWFGNHLSREEIKEFIKKYFTIVWLRYFKLQIPFLLRNRKIFGDLETWIVWGNIALSAQQKYSYEQKKKIFKDNLKRESYLSALTNAKFKHGVNASSISDISNIPRATAIRKLKWLLKQNVISRNKSLEYQLKKTGTLYKTINENLVLNNNLVAEFLTDIFDYIKNSNFKL